MKTWLKYQFKYNFKCWIYLPITFLRRVVLGKDELAKRFFWDKWGFLPKSLIELAKTQNSIWIIANSGGEVAQSIAFFKKLRVLYPNYNLILSTESYDTFQFVQTQGEIDFVFFTPWDMSLVCRKVLKIIRPKIMIFIEYCYFPVLVKESKKAKIKSLLLSAKIDFHFLKGNYLLERSFALEFYRFLNMISVKSDEDLKNLFVLGADREKTAILGDMRLDLSHISLREDEKEKLRGELKLSKGELVFIVGSIHKGEVNLILEGFKLLRGDYACLKLIFAPRWKQDIPFMEDEIRKYGYSYKLRSRFTNSDGAYDILILDTFGELAKLYGIATVAFIASSIIPINVRRLGHNIFEPLAHGLPTLFGPHMDSWRKIADYLREIWPGCQVNDARSLACSINQLLSDKDLFSRLRDAALDISKDNSDIVNRYLEVVKKNLS